VKPMTKRQGRRLPFWLRHLDLVREGQQAAHTGLSNEERLDLAMLLMAEGLSQLSGPTKKGVKGRLADPDVVDRRLRQFAELDQRWMKAERR